MAPNLYHHQANGTFRNIKGSPISRASSREMRQFIWQALFKNFKAYQTCSYRHVLHHDLAQLRWQTTPGDKIQWLGHSAFRWQLDQTTLVSDPFLSKRASPFSWLGPKRFINCPVIPQDIHTDTLLLTHNHYDHLDTPALKKLPNKDSIKVVVPLKVGSLLKSLGFKYIIELDWYEQTQINSLIITLLPAVHFSSRGLFDRNKTLWGGYLVQSTQQKIYLSGDTAFHPTLFQELGERYGPVTHSLVSIGAYKPANILQGAHITPEQAVQIGIQMKSDCIIPHHWGTILLATENPFEPSIRFKLALDEQGFSEQQGWLMQIGETRAF